MDILRPYLSRIIAALLAGLVTWLTGKGITLQDSDVKLLTESGVTILLVGFNVLYAILHRTIDKRLNPADTASSHLAVEGKIAANAAKSALPPANGF